MPQHGGRHTGGAAQMPRRCKPCRHEAAGKRLRPTSTARPLHACTPAHTASAVNTLPLASGSSIVLEACRMPAQAPSVACTDPLTVLSCGRSAAGGWAVAQGTGGLWVGATPAAQMSCPALRLRHAATGGPNMHTANTRQHAAPLQRRSPGLPPAPPHQQGWRGMGRPPCWRP